MPDILPPPQTANVAHAQSARQSVAGAASVYSYATKNNVLQAEILWILKTAVDHNSYRSSGDIEKFMIKMFPDSDIANRFTRDEKKLSIYVYSVLLNNSEVS